MKKVGVMSRTIFQKITSSLWVLISFIPFFNGLGFVYIGNKYANANWFLEGILYELPLILGVLTIPKIEIAPVLFLIGSLVNIVVIIRSLMVDYTLQKRLDEGYDVAENENILESLGEKLENAIDNFWVLISFIPFFNGFGFIYKGETASNKSLLREGIAYELIWLIGIFALAFQPVRFVGIKIAFVFYMASIIRSIMVATEPQPIYANRGLFNKKAKINKESVKKSEDVKEVKIEEEKFENKKTAGGVIPAYQFYEKQFKELECIYPQKEKNAMELVEKRFAPPQLTYTRFKRVVDESHETFYSQLSAGYSILELSSEYSTKVEDELKNKLVVLNSIIRGLDKLSEELVINISKVESESEDEIDQFFEEFSRVTGSVKTYN